MANRYISQTNNLIVKNVIKGISRLLINVADMDRRGVSEEFYQGELMGKSKSGREIKVSYKYGVKVGLDDYVKKLKEKNVRHVISRPSK